MKFLGMNIFDTRSAAKQEQEQEQVARFNKTMEIANNIAMMNPHALLDFIRALIRPLQSEHILAVAERDDHKAPGAIDGSSFFFSSMEVFSHSKHYIRDAPKVVLNLSCDPILPTPWRRDGFVNALANIGAGKKCGAWEQEQNHVVSLWLPWGIGFVMGGNHSISSGILSGKNIPIVAEEIYDFSPVLDLIECDGTTYKNKQTGEVLAEVADHRRAAIFEIGRLMVKHKVTATAQQ